MSLLSASYAPLPMNSPKSNNITYTPHGPRSTRKRKADDDGVAYLRNDSNDDSSDEHMAGLSPSGSPNISSRGLQSSSAERRGLANSSKRFRSTLYGRPLPLPRLLDTMDEKALRSMLLSLVDGRPDLASNLVSLAPKPTVQSAMVVLRRFENNLSQAFPFGGDSGGEYAYNRVRPALLELLEALSDFTPHFLPPNESQPATSLNFLDGATEIIHKLPVWTNIIHNHHKDLAYEEISKAWVGVIREAAKRGSGIGLQYGSWDVKLVKHNDASQGKMSSALSEIRKTLGWLCSKELGDRQQRFAGFNVQPTIVPIRSWS